MTRKRLPSLAAQRILPLLLLAGCATASQRSAIDLGAVEQFADETADWERIPLQADQASAQVVENSTFIVVR